ncbi:peptidase dimerization domain-containing protein [Gemella cuniculi]|uniref:peptidase dimerization domain-containing protein n=1 Tax=Gemella cuniculi TaxID=150240 RepID=UPI000425EE91|nr:peptidase dimerization domain-containing protein [Gemella cuniculi]
MTKYILTLFGKGGHGAEPHEAIDTTVIVSEFVKKSSKHSNIEIISVISGDAFNVISGKAEVILKSNNKRLIENLASSLLIFYGENTRYTLKKI